MKAIRPYAWQMGSEQKKAKTVQGEINRQNQIRQRNLILIGLPILVYVVTGEWSHLQMSVAELQVRFGSETVTPELFENVLWMRGLLLLLMLVLGFWGWWLRDRPEKLYWPTTLFTLLTGGMLSAIAALALQINLSLDIFLIGLFVYCALFFMPPVIAVLFCFGSLAIYLIGASQILPDVAPAFRASLFVNGGIMAIMAFIVCVQNYRSKHAELSALTMLSVDNQDLQEAKRAIEITGATDSLTGVLNRRSLDHDLARMRARSDHYALAMIDLDYFKRYNDHYGHQAGDRTLKSVAKALQDTVSRSGDAVYRYGGEEFVVLLPHTPLEGASVAVEKLREAVEKLAIVHEYRPDDSRIVTISAGVAHTLEEGYDAVIDLADKRLYVGKAGGRNRIDSGQETPA